MRAEAGFTLLEAVVALSIVGITSVGVLEAVAAETRTAARARTALEAEAIAVDRLERLRLLPPAELAHLPDSLRTGTLSPPLQRYTWTAAIVPDPGRPDLFDATATVHWDGGEYAITTRLYRPPLQVRR